MIVISPRKVVSSLSVMIFSLGIANLLVNGAKCFLGRGGLWGITRLFDLDSENNIPTWYSSITLLMCAGLLGLIAYQKQQQHDRFMMHWRVLAIIFLWISIDEASSVHELLIQLNSLLGTSGFLLFAWVIPGMILLVLFGCAYWTFWTALSLKVKRLFLLAFVLYVSGGLVMEMIGGQYIEVFAVTVPISNYSGWAGMGMALILACEELLEMAGVAVFIYALLVYLSRGTNTFQLSFSQSQIQFDAKHHHPDPASRVH